MDQSDISSSSADESKSPAKNETRNKRHWKKTEMAKEKKLDAQRQYMVIGTLALLLIILCDFFM